MDRSPPRSSLFKAIEKHLPSFEPAVVFDVGANTGQSALPFLPAFPRATIYAFEPVPELFRALVSNVGEHERFRPFNLALGDSTGTAHMQERGRFTSRIVEKASFFQRLDLKAVSIAKGDEFCADQNVGRIGFLKIDTEGHDLKVLMGFRWMLSEMRIDLVEAEVGMSPDNPLHVPFESVKAHLEGLRYRLFHLYELAMDTRYSGRPVMRRCNAVFASEALVEANRRTT